MKKYAIFVASLALIALLALAACSRPVAAQGGPTTETGSDTPTGQVRRKHSDAPGGERSSTVVNRRACERVPDEMPVEELSDAEAEGILYMREEEKLARDVYLTLGEQWNLPIWSNIADSEGTHMEAVKTLIDRYGLEDPINGTVRGEFANQDLQALYNRLVERGSQSLVDALRVGAAIEEIDILDLQTHAAQTEKADVRRVYDSLTRGSENHLRSFVFLLERQGETYEPAYLETEEFNEIVSSPVDRGRGQDGNEGRRSRGR
jgi:hypothetical protein